MSNISSMLENDVDKKVDSAIEAFLRSLSQIGPELMSVRSMDTFILRFYPTKSIYLQSLTFILIL